MKGLVKYFIAAVIPFAAGLLLLRAGALTYKKFTGGYPSYPPSVVLFLVGFGVGKVICDPIANRYGEDNVNTPEE